MTNVIDEDDHSTHWTTHPYTGDRIEEASIVRDGERIFWCGFSEPSAQDDG